MYMQTRKAFLLTPLVILALASTAASSARNFRAHLAGRNEVPPVDTRAQGQAVFNLNKEGDELSFRLIAANIEEVTQAHIHCGAAGVNGPVVAFLYGFGPVVSPDGVLAQGVLDASDVIARPDSAACPGGVADFDDLIGKIRSGDAYVNVHTLGFPGGEIRGQIR